MSKRIKFEIPSILFYKYRNTAYAHPKNEHLVEDLTQLGMKVIINEYVDPDNVYLVDDDGKTTILVVR